MPPSILNVCCLFVTWEILAFAPVFGAAPDNDNFANRRALVGNSVVASMDITDATVEPGEPADTNCVGLSVWWTWTAPAAGTLNIRTYAYCSVWSGDSLGTLTLLSSNRYLPCVPQFPTIDPGGGAPPMALEVAAGESIQILLAATRSQTDNNFRGGIAEFVLDFTTVRLLEPANGASFLEEEEVTFHLSPPEPGIDDGVGRPNFLISPGPYLAPAPGSWMTVSSNLAPGNYTVLAQFTNGAHRLFTTLPRTFHIRPANDDFARATELASLPAESHLCFHGATAEAGETLLPGQGSPGSLWWRWVASESGELVVSAPVAALGAYTGDQLETLTLKTNGTGSIAVPVEAGTTYYLKAAWTNEVPSGGLIVVVWPPAPDPCSSGSAFGHIYFTMRPANDNFERRKVLAGSMITESADNFVATTQGDEPEQAGSQTLWWTWTAPASGLVSLVLDPPGYIVQASIWQGEVLSNLTLITANEMAFGPGAFPRLYQFPSHEGDTFQICVGNTLFSGDGLGGRFISFSLDLCSMRITEPKDAAERIGPTNVTVHLSPPRADVEGAISGIVFQAMSSETRDCCSIFGADFRAMPLLLDPLTGVFTNLPPDDYWIYAQMTNGAGRLITTLTNLVHVRPPNDSFSAATPIGALPFLESYQLSSATDEPGEPVVSPQSLPGSVWWRWTAPATKVVVAHADGPIGVFTGDHLEKLKPAAFAPSGLYFEYTLRLSAKAGKTYLFKVSPWLFRPSWKVGLKGRFLLTDAWPNDDFAHRIALIGDDLTIIVPNTIASVEPHEPSPETYLPSPQSLWWTWTAPTNGLVLLELLTPPGGAPLLEVFSGDRLRKLSRRDLLDSPLGPYLHVRSGENLQLAFSPEPASTNAVYRLRVFPDPLPDEIGRPVRHGNGHEFSFSVNAKPGGAVILETSSDLVHWSEHLTFTSTNKDPVLIGPIIVGPGTQFFRTRR